eukprot:TRINITY_DN15765_c0_g1::TRINITY_DN15765_c0_g1_i1::g.25519::m.25519 TRINITY_DN15765_c0_g1::TRINITY_DN15765_c0_g1_i1::g.25519  ORF type:complete len:358 (-),score=24.28,sp/D3ZND0/UVSSA_RAT/30.86/1e-17,Androgen_recep/PF02166.11/0.011,Androgen_recep/PF02166.11/6.4e+02 TRINITY_DN15765_c0_g1_i1:131-1153(-)
MAQLKKPHAQIRLLVLLLMDEIFSRSSVFRSLLTANFESFFSLVLASKPPDPPLPPPHRFAKLLSEKTLELVAAWTEKFGKCYRQLEIAKAHLDRTYAPSRSSAAPSPANANPREEMRTKFERLVSITETDLPQIGICTAEATEALSLIIDAKEADADDNGDEDDSGEEGDESGSGNESHAQEPKIKDASTRSENISYDASLLQSLYDGLKMCEGNLVRIREWRRRVNLVDSTCLIQPERHFTLLRRLSDAEKAIDDLQKQAQAEGWSLTALSAALKRIKKSEAQKAQSSEPTPEVPEAATATSSTSHVTDTPSTIAPSEPTRTQPSTSSLPPSRPTTRS